MSRVLRRIRNMVINHDKNLICIFVGKTGSGKSFSACKMAKWLDKDFNVDRVVFTARQFMDLYNSGKLKKGSALVWDELGAGGMTARNWYSTQNKVINHIMMTFRDKNYYCIFTVPDIGFIDKNIRRLIHCVVETQSIDYVNKQVICKFFHFQTNPVLGKIYRKYPVIKVNGIVKKITKFRIGKPDEEFIEKYKEKKGKFQDLLKGDANASIKKDEKREIRETFNVDSALEDLKNNFPQTDKLSRSRIQAYFYNKGLPIGGGYGSKLNALWKIYYNKKVIKDEETGGGA